jgi:hypothetical protein
VGKEVAMQSQRRRIAGLAVPAVALLLVLGAALPAPAAARPHPSGVRASASFDVNPTGCRRTSGTITVDETFAAGRRADTGVVSLTYVVISTCAEGDYLYYSDIHTVGPAAIDPGDFDVTGSLRRAILRTDVPVFDEEAYFGSDLGIRVEWTTRTVRGTKELVATIDVDDTWVAQYNTNPITTRDASLAFAW